MFRRNSILCVCAVLALWSAAPVLADSGKRHANIEWREGRLSLNADGVPLHELLAAVAARTGVEVVGLAAVEGSASVRFTNLTLRAGLEALLTRFNYAMFEHPPANGGEGRVVVIVVGRKSSPDSQRREHAAAPEPDVYQAVERLAEQGNLRALRDAAFSDDPLTQALAMQRLAREDPAAAGRVAMNAAGSPDSTQRVLAIQVLGGLDGPEATGTLGSALQDDDAGVRHAALVGLMSRTSPTAIEFLVQALQDREASIRLLALETLAQRGAAGEFGVSIALNDHDPAVRTRAQEALDRMRTAR